MAERVARVERGSGGILPFARFPLALLWFPGGLLLAFILLPLLRMGLAQSWQTLSGVAVQSEVQAAIWLSLESAAITALVAACLGAPLAYLLAHGQSRIYRLVDALVDLPLAVPHTVAGIALLFVFGREGIVGSLTAPIGLAFWGTQAAIVVAMLFVSVPFMVNSARLGFEGIDPRLEKVARTLGLTSFEVLYRVDLPLAWRGILTGMALTYARAISEIGSVMVLAYYPMTAPVKIYDLYLQSGLQESSAMAVLLLMVTLSTFLVMRALVNASWRPGRT